MTVDRVVPQSLLEEEALLGGMLQSGRARATALEVGVRSDDFYRPAHRVVFEAIGACAEDGGAVDELAVIGQLRRSEMLDAAGGASRVAGLVEQCPAVANSRVYAEEVRRSANLRRVLDAAERLAEGVYQPGAQPDAVLDEAATLIAATRERVERRERRRGVEAWQWACDWTGSVIHGKGEEPAPRVPWPVEDLNDVTAGGQAAGWVVVTTGWTGDGKSWWGLDCVETALDAMPDDRVAVFTGEMPADEVLERMLAMGGVDYGRVLRRDKSAKREFQESLGRYASWRDRLFVFDGGVSVAKIERELLAARLAGRPYRYVLVDHLHLLDEVHSTREPRHAIAGACRRLKSLAVEHGVTMHLLAQCRKIEAGVKHKPPALSDLAESTTIEQIADLAMCVYREREDNDPSARRAEGSIRVLKARSAGVSGPIRVVFGRPGYRFRPPVTPVRYVPGVVA